MARRLRSVLLVDDDKVTNLMHMRLIRRSGLIDHVDVVTDGLAALEYLKEKRINGLPTPEMILLDINMPRMDGFEFLEDYASLSVKFRPVKPMIIMLSTSVLRADQDRAEADPNVYRFISKPIGADDIAGFVNQYQRFAAH
ncbi:Protein-glutamate methylesterase/protein-glutamine glutaminase [Roseobacter fucihabitans]|uniref:Protein-glutamate methylesterase/protein-glutamine glutaminase n=1 Tax=Roseobacter fucihabitans TaxID=1537242 RepID=A0ABZ2BP81_9RHOB